MLTAARKTSHPYPFNRNRDPRARLDQKPNTWRTRSCTNYSFTTGQDYVKQKVPVRQDRPQYQRERQRKGEEEGRGAHLLSLRFIARSLRVPTNNNRSRRKSVNTRLAREVRCLYQRDAKPYNSRQDSLQDTLWEIFPSRLFSSPSLNANKKIYIFYLYIMYIFIYLYNFA